VVALGHQRSSYKLVRVASASMPQQTCILLICDTCILDGSLIIFTDVHTTLSGCDHIRHVKCPSVKLGPSMIRDSGVVALATAPHVPPFVLSCLSRLCVACLLDLKGCRTSHMASWDCQRRHSHCLGNHLVSLI
jgi:hypothetical protein